jgi:hypothetical protein
MKTIMLVVMMTVLLVSGMNPVAAQEEENRCISVEQTTEEVVPGVFLTYDSEVLCASMEPTGVYAVTVHVKNEDTSVERPVTIDRLFLSHTTPRPRMTAPEATVDVDGLPIELMPGSMKSFAVSGEYTLVQTGQGMKANLHLRAAGYANMDWEPFILGINVMLRSEDHDELDDLDDNGPPDWAPGPPPWAIDNDDENGGPPAWVPGPPPWAGEDDDDDDDNGGPPSWVPARRP